MKIRYFAETDTLNNVFREGPVAETRDLDENTLLDVDSQGEHLCHHGRACLGADRNSGILLRADPDLTFAARSGDCGLVVFGAKVISPTVDERIEILEGGLERNLGKGVASPSGTVESCNVKFQGVAAA